MLKKPQEYQDKETNDTTAGCDDGSVCKKYSGSAAVALTGQESGEHQSQCKCVPGFLRVNNQEFQCPSVPEYQFTRVPMALSSTAATSSYQEFQSLHTPGPSTLECMTPSLDKDGSSASKLPVPEDFKVPSNPSHKCFSIIHAGLCPIFSNITPRMEVHVPCRAKDTDVKAEYCIKLSITEVQNGAELIGFANTTAQSADAFVYLGSELTAVLLLAGTLEMCARELEDKTVSMVYFTDSTIAMSWINNISKQLKLFVMHKVDLVRKSILHIRNFDCSGAEENNLPLCCAESSRNQANMLTKRMDGVLEKLHLYSVWYRGQPWMAEDADRFEFTSYHDLQLNAKVAGEMLQRSYRDPVLLKSVDCNHCYQYSKEMLGLVCHGLEDSGQHFKQCICNPSSINTQASSLHTSAEGWPEYLINPVKLGWKRAEAVIGLVATSVQALKHKLQDALKGLERFAARYGAPAILCVDNGTNLMASDKAELTTKDLAGELKVRLHMEVRMTNAKSYED